MKEQVLLLHRLAQQLRTKRFAMGAFAFEKVEVKFDLDEAGKPLGIKFREMGTANQLIEEFMLLAKIKGEYRKYGEYDTMTELIDKYIALIDDINQERVREGLTKLITWKKTQ